MSQTILITGTSSGFGRLMSETLLSKGHKVVATMRNIEGRNKENANDLAAKGAVVIEMDVTNDESVTKAIHSAIKTVGNIDVVVNNAGVGVSGRQESFEIKDWQRLFDINVYGVQRVLRAVIPHFREKKKGSIVNVSSILGRTTIPYYGPYNASKFALEGLTENYRLELSQFGISTHLIEPGGFPTTFMERLIRPSDNSREAYYQDIHPSPEEFGTAFGEALAANPQQNPQDVADALLNLIETQVSKRPFRVLVDKLGMGAAVQEINKASEQVSSGLAAAFGFDHLLKVK
jgi:NAD(P)-dependent dehydrogenase (short-subunit alcohol dehydrogenase family)